MGTHSEAATQRSSLSLLRGRAAPSKAEQVCSLISSVRRVNVAASARKKNRDTQEKARLGRTSSWTERSAADRGRSGRHLAIYCVEIGPGRGAITEILAQSAGRLIAIEYDRKLARQLRMAYSLFPGVGADPVALRLHHDHDRLEVAMEVKELKRMSDVRESPLLADATRSLKMFESTESTSASIDTRHGTRRIGHPQLRGEFAIILDCNQPASTLRQDFRNGAASGADLQHK